jgi:biopolymer transport protein ExbD
MTLNSGKSGEMSSEINVTPMIDVLLVLLIIFMVIVPVTSRGEAAVAPRPSVADAGPYDPVILEVLKGSGTQAVFRIRGQDVALSELPRELAAIYSTRAERVMFIKGDDGLSFTQVAEAIDIGHAAGVDRIGLMAPKVLAGQ